MTFADKILEFNRTLTLDKSILPDGIDVMNPFGDPDVQLLTKLFYQKYFADDRKRYMVIGINPGRFGGGTTGIPFTDPHKLTNICGISVKKLSSPELSADFIYQMIQDFGGPKKFYGKFFLTAVSPLGFVKTTNGKSINYNYYDSRELLQAIKLFATESIKKQLGFGIHRSVCFCLGTGKNFDFLSRLNNEHQFFGSIVPLSHPRFIMQYRRKKINEHIEEYLRAFQLAD